MSYKSDTFLCRRLDITGSPSLFPADGPAMAAICALKVDEPVEVRIVKERSLPQHRLFWSVLKHVAENSKFESAERLLVALKVRLGWYDPVRLLNGKIIAVPHSIAFARMEQADFQDFFDRSIAVICDEVLAGYDADRLIRESQGVMPA